MLKRLSKGPLLLVVFYRYPRYANDFFPSSDPLSPLASLLAKHRAQRQ
jgi:hypothetical protein